MSAALAADYRGALTAHLQKPGEATLLDAYEIGRRALSAGLGVLDIASIHHGAVRGLPLPVDEARAAEFFAEALSPFEMSLRGYREANDRLTALNETLRRANAEIDAANRALEDRVRERTAALAAANEALKQEMADRQKAEAQLVHAQKMEAIGNLTGGMAHDFNNILGVIIGNLDELTARHADHAEIQDFAGEGLAAALRGAELTRRLLAFARRQPLQPERIDINDLVAGILKLLARTLGENIEISFEPGGSIWPVVADPAQLESTLANLATNARDAMPAGGRLTIVTANRHLDADYAAQHNEVAAGDYVMIEVHDTGAGMSAEVLGKVFEPFFTTKERGRGTGLGLAMVFGFMKQSGGHINVYSEEGVGTTFRLYLPRAAAQGARAGRAAAVSLQRGRGETVLVVEDNPSMRRVVVRQLAELGYSVREAENAVAALAQLEAGGIDLLFTDLVMPGGVSGLDLMRVALERWPGLRAALTSGFPEMKVGEETIGAGRLRVLSKPYRKEELARLIREILDTGAP